ncbi:hypothetical protein KFK09_016183 [Dendrobium nobile]|uniref:DUF4283 domain-containing protein n=1 Tax=Dendrobium nobile TaxID=94219 RepID=A0A8T3AYP3_DENNO|nr:hypothetical protein KFK09_016183 [Dendrobium nobile]
MDGKSHSFKEALAGGSLSTPKLTFVHASYKGSPALLFEEAVVDQLAAPFAFTLVGKFILRRPNLDVIRKFFFNLKLSCSFHVGLLDQRHIAIQLSNDLDYSRIFSRRAYYIQGCQMRLLKWTPDFDVREESPIAPVWLAFPNLRHHFFNQQILFGLASIFGRPLQMDQATASISRPSVARVLVELDVSKKYPNEIWLGSEVKGYFQKVEIENLPIFCSFCKMHGHAASECFKKFPNLRVPKKSNTQADEVCAEKGKEILLEHTENLSCPAQVEAGPSEILNHNCINQDNFKQNGEDMDSFKVMENVNNNSAVNGTDNMVISTACNDVITVTNAEISMATIVEQENIALHVHLIGEGADNNNVSCEEGEISPIIHPLANSTTSKGTGFQGIDNMSDDGKFMEDDGSTLNLEGKSPTHSHYKAYGFFYLDQQLSLLLFGIN